MDAYIFTREQHVPLLSVVAWRWDSSTAKNNECKSSGQQSKYTPSMLYTTVKKNHLIRAKEHKYPV